MKKKCFDSQWAFMISLKDGAESKIVYYLV